jgi:hypothetical protein
MHAAESRQPLCNTALLAAAVYGLGSAQSLLLLSASRRPTSRRLGRVATPRREHGGAHSPLECTREILFSASLDRARYIVVRLSPAGVRASILRPSRRTRRESNPTHLEERTNRGATTHRPMHRCQYACHHHCESRILFSVVASTRGGAGVRFAPVFVVVVCLRFESQRDTGGRHTLHSQLDSGETRVRRGCAPTDADM